MTLAKKSFPAVLAALVILLVINTAIARILPTENASHSGSSSDGKLSVAYAIYETANLAGSEEEELFESVMGSIFIYAYQIYNEEGSDFDITSLQLSGLGNDAIADDDDISSMEDSLGDPGDQNDRGVLPYENERGNDAETGYGFAKWIFGGVGSIIDAGDHSYWLIIQSNNHWRTGTYSFGDDEIVAAGDERPNLSTVPEPITITLLGIGGLFLRKTGKRA